MKLPLQAVYPSKCQSETIRKLPDVLLISLIKYTNFNLFRIDTMNIQVVLMNINRFWIIFRFRDSLIF